MRAVEECLRSIQAKTGWTLAVIADKVGSNTSSLHEIRQGRAKYPNFFVIAELHKLAGRSLDELVGIQAPEAEHLPGTFDAASVAKALLHEMGSLMRGHLIMSELEAREAEPVRVLEQDAPQQHSATQARIMSRQVLKEALDEIEAAYKEREHKNRRKRA